jgi:hypothetical protein
MYNVRFGDAILLSIPETDADGNETTIHVLIDAGNALAGTAGQDEVFAPVFADIAAVLGGRPLDLYVMTHEHMDHVQGALYASRKLGFDLKARHVWMTASTAPGYYDRFTDARKKRLAALSALGAIEAFLATSAAPPPPQVESLLALNNPRSSGDCVDFIRGIGAEPPVYVHRGASVEGHHPFRTTRVRILAPEENTAVYYGRLGPPALAVFAEDAPALLASDMPRPPPGVAAGDFYDLVRFRASGMAANLLAIDKAANNSSVVLEIEWRGVKLLLPGDAEEKSWEIMRRSGQLSEVDFLKVSHHGSHNGTPPDAFDIVMPEGGRTGRKAAVSTAPGAYEGVPDDATLTLVGSRAELFDTRHVEPGGFVDIEFEGR